MRRLHSSAGSPSLNWSSRSPEWTTMVRTLRAISQTHRWPNDSWHFLQRLKWSACTNDFYISEFTWYDGHPSLIFVSPFNFIAPHHLWRENIGNKITFTNAETHKRKLVCWVLFDTGPIRVWGSNLLWEWAFFMGAYSHGIRATWHKHLATSTWCLMAEVCLV